MPKTMSGVPYNEPTIKSKIPLDGKLHTVIESGTTWLLVGFKCGCYMVDTSPQRKDGVHPDFNACPEHHMRLYRKHGAV